LSLSLYNRRTCRLWRCRAVWHTVGTAHN
jgi:hypothetical protein